MKRRKYYIDKKCTNMGGSKMLKKPNEEKIFLSRIKIQKLSSPKLKRAEKT